jgi:CheY-like chemotaxis protein
MTTTRVLIVDDDPGVRGLLSTLLDREGHTAEFAEDGVAAVEKLRRNSYAVVLLDLMLPAVNGFEIIRLLKSDRPDQLKRIIVMTAAANRTLEHFDDEREIFSLVRKPFDIGDLTRKVRDCASQNGH